VKPVLEFFFDYGSPWSYVAFTQVPRIAQAAGATIAYRPMLLGGVFKATGNQSPAEQNVPAKRVYSRREFQRYATRYAIPFSHNPHFPINTMTLMRGAAWAEIEGRLVEYSGAIFEAMWVKPENLGEPAVLAPVLSRAGFDPAAFQAGVAREDVKQRLRATTEEAVSRGVFGAPTFFVGTEMFFGQDRLDFVAEALQAAKTEA
jgi:2-hydroxychromene-2-carboxylate isomerase